MHEEENRTLQIVKIVLSAALFAGLMIWDRVGLPEGFDGTWREAVLYLIPYLIVGYETLFEAFEKLFKGELFDEDFLMLVASVAALAIGEYDEAVAVMLFFQVGELFEDYAVDRSRDSITGLMDLAPEMTDVCDAEGHITAVPSGEVEPGTHIVIRPGERVPIDCTVTEGSSYMDTSALTGESVPISVEAGAALCSGFINGQGTLHCVTERAYEDSAAARILSLVENAAEHKSVTENFITRFARVYTPIVTISAVLLAVVPGLITGEWGVWIKRACTFLVVSCPCALVISVPLGFFAAIGAASRRGILIKGSNYLEAAAGISVVAFDKTGTLTKGEFSVHAILPARCSEEELLELAAAVEAESTHPIAVSITRECTKRSRTIRRAFDVSQIPGRGMSGTVDGRHVLAGNAAFMEEQGITVENTSAYGTIVYVAADGVFMGSIAICDSIKDNAGTAIAALRAAGVNRTLMLTGDAAQSAAAVAETVGIDEYYSGLLPEDKVTKLEDLLRHTGAEHRTLAFLGDGINDAPVLTLADVGIAMGGLGADAAIEAADIVIMDDDLSKIPVLIRLARLTMRTVRTNIAFALAVKLLVLILGAAGLVGLWAAVFADVGVMILCVLNSILILGRNMHEGNGVC